MKLHEGFYLPVTKWVDSTGLAKLVDILNVGEHAFIELLQTRDDMWLVNLHTKNEEKWLSLKRFGIVTGEGHDDRR